MVGLQVVSGRDADLWVTASGVSQSVACAVRIFGPGGATILFALSVGKHILGGWLIWIVMGILALITAISGLLIPPT